MNNDITIREAPKMNWLTLSFSGELEKRFQDDYYWRSIRHVRVSCLLAIFFYAVFGILDAWLFPEVSNRMLFIRFGIFIPLVVVVLLFSFTKWFPRYWQFCISLVVLVAGWGIVAMIVMAPSPKNYLYYAGLILVLIFDYTFFKLRFIWASLVGWLIVLAYEVSAIWLSGTPIPILVNNNFFFLTSNVIGMFACYSIEFYLRNDFIQVRLLETEREKVKAANRELENRVAERTAELTQANVDLKQEVQERRRTEQALRDSEQRFRSLSDNSPEIIYTLDKDGAFNYVNPAWERVLGHKPDEVTGKFFIDFARKDDAKLYVRLFKRIRDGKETLRDVVGTLAHKEGTERIFSLSGAPNLDGAGNVIGMVGLLKDITKQQLLQTQLERAQKMARLGNWELDIGSGRLTCSEEVFHIFGTEPTADPVDLEMFFQVVHREDCDFVKDCIEQAPLENKNINIEHRIVLPDKSERIVHQVAEVMRDRNMRPIKMVGAVQDITEIRRSEEQMRLLGRVFEKTIEGILVTDEDGVIEMVNPAFTAITGYKEDEAVGAKPSILNSGRQGPEYYQDLWAHLTRDGHWQGEIWNRRKNGEAYPEWLTITAMQDQRGRITHYVGVFHDITELKRSEEQITYQAYHDALTDLPNRLLFNDRLTMATAQARRKNQGLSLLFLDLDNFKNINDSLGHAVGDLLLQSVAKRLLRWVREEDSVARLGGDEFIILLSVDDPDYAVHVAQRILDSLGEPFWIKGHELYISASIGITLCPQDGNDPETLVSNADLAMYQAKARGRNNYQFFTPALNARVRQRIALEGSMRRALERNEFQVYYQPKVELESGNMVGFEALVRWERPEVGLVPPNDFIPVAEETGLIVELGKFVLETACRQTRQWHDQGYPHLHVAVNLSPRQFQQKDLVDMVRKTLKDTGLPPNCLELEVTENVVMYSVEDATHTLRELNELGVNLSLDDFGRGYSSLYYLKRFPIQTLKIDRSFVCDIIDNPDDAAIVNTIISMSRNLNLKVIAEGVETEQQLDFLKQHQCDQMQGFLFSRPVPAAEIDQYLNDKRSLK
jgi:diguanylate cyclase (GGDEF)-like protein/PAS domain S-box-containing protein